MATLNDSILTTADLLTLVESGRELASQIDLDVLLKNLLRKATELTDSQDSSVILYNDTRNTLYFAGATGAKAEMLLKKWGEFSLEQIPIEGSQAGEVFTSRKSIIIGTMPWLVVAGLVEGFLTPAGKGLTVVLLVGFALGAIFWGLVLWRGAPESPTVTAEPAT